MDSTSTNSKKWTMDTKSRLNNIVITGYMGSGKSSVARAIAKDIGRFYLDTDLLIESLENDKIKNIFQRHGEAYFRALEKELFLWLQKSVKNCVISTGGGFVIYNEDIKKLGRVFFLDAALESIKERVTKEEQELRPLFAEPEVVELLYNQRMPIYQGRSDYVIDANREIEKIVEDIKNRWIASQED